MNNSGRCWQITFAKQEADKNEFGEFLESWFDVVTCDYTEDGFDIWSGSKDSHFNEQEFLSYAKGQNISLPPYEAKLLESEDWLKDNVIKFAPVEADKFLIYGVHEKEAPKTDKLAIRIYAATAFGSEHQTTRSCLQAICDLDNGKKAHKNILDVGCGSGILSLAAAKLWPDSKITAVDIDDEAVIVTNQNAKDNGVEQQIDCFLSNGYQNAKVLQNAPYDIILSNILARPLIEMAPDLAKNLKSGGFAVVSGFVADQEEWVVNAHLEQGLKLVKTYQFDNWRAALLEKK